MNGSIENRMVVDSEWKYDEPVTIGPSHDEKYGYENITDYTFIPADDALDYAREHEEQENMTDKEFVDWFFSGNWIRRCRNGIKNK